MSLLLAAYITASYFGAAALVVWAILHRGDYYAEMQKQIPKGYYVIYSWSDRGYVVMNHQDALIGTRGVPSDDCYYVHSDYEKAIQMAIIADRRQRISDRVGESLVDWNDGYAQRQAQRIESMRKTIDEWGKTMIAASELNKKDAEELFGADYEIL